MIAKRSKRGTHRRRRPRRPMAGMLLHIDGSKHCWFQNSQRYDLIVILDDATSEIYYAQLVEEESTRTVMAGLREVIESKRIILRAVQRSGKSFLCDIEGRRTGRQASFDTSRESVKGTRSADDCGLFAAGARTLGDGILGLGKGACRRSFGWRESARWKEANRFLREHYIEVFNGKFMVAAEEKATAFRRTGRPDLDWIFTLQTERVVAKDNTVAIGGTSVADREVSFPQYASGLHGNNSRTPGRTGVAALRPPCGRTV